MRYLSWAAAAALFAVPVSAQPIHGHPQKAAYASPAEWPELFDGQMHWAKFDAIQTQHCVHLIPKFMYGAEWGDDAVVVPFTLKMFHCAASVTAVYGEGLASVTMDGDTTFPIKGDPGALLTFTGKATFDPTRPAFKRFHKQHGWTNVRFAASVAFDNGDVGYHNVWMSYFSIVDRSVPEAVPPGDYGPIISIRDTVFPVSKTNFGDMVMEVEDWLPLLPINTPWFFRVSAYNYTSTAPCCPDGLLEQRRDMDFHNGVPGKIIVSNPANQQGFSTRTLMLDPATMTKGPHKDGLFWKSTFGSETISALLTFSYVVGDSVTPVTPVPPVVPVGPVPELCADPTATNTGQPLPCTFAAPPPAVCQESKATNVGKALPCVFPRS